MVTRMRKFKVVELYAGTARSVEPFRSWRRAETALLIDANDFARRTYLANFPEAPYLRRSLAGMTAGEVLDAAGGRIDVLLGCPPCQGFSESGLRSAGDPRNWHVRNFADIAAHARPLAVVMENVPTVAESRQFTYLIERLRRLGYECSSTIANSAQYGSCQTRQRVMLIAFRKDVGIEPRFPKPSHGGDAMIFGYSSSAFVDPNKHQREVLGITPASQRLAQLMTADFSERLGKKPLVTIGDILQGMPRVGSSDAKKLHHSAWAHSSQVLRRMGGVREGHQWKGGKDHFSHSYGRLHRLGLARTITTFFPYAGSGRFWHPTANRSLTAREAARIQGFPDQFGFIERSKKTAALIGNALDSALADVCYGMVRKALEA
jgi:DNA (cytosine-5)-methyltransferase 1